MHKLCDISSACGLSSVPILAKLPALHLADKFNNNIDEKLLGSDKIVHTCMVVAFCLLSALHNIVVVTLYAKARQSFENPSQLLLH